MVSDTVGEGASEEVMVGEGCGMGGLGGRNGKK